MKKVLILFGGNSFEHEISCRSVNFVTKHIDPKLFDYKLVGIDYTGNWYEIEKNIYITEKWKNNVTKNVNNIIEYAKDFDIVFPVIHGFSGEDGKLQSIFELFNINYVGSDSYTSLICYDKLLTKLLLEKHDIPQVPYFIYNENTKIERIKFPVIIKPCKCGSSIGISVVNNEKELLKGIREAKKYDYSIIVEKYLKNNIELECALLETKNDLIISDIGEIITNNKWYDYSSKYEENTKTIISNIDDTTKENIKLLSKKIFKVLNCKKISRIDFLFDVDNNKLYFNEINTIPGFTEISMFPKLMKSIKVEYKDLITYILSS